MKNKQKGFVVPLLIAIIALLVIGGGIYVYENKKAEVPIVPVNTDIQATNQIQQNAIQNPPVTNPNIVTYKTYNDSVFNLSFEYPTSWSVKESFYATPGQEDNGEKGDVVALWVTSPTGAGIVIGGRQVECQPSNSTIKAACFKNIPITTTATDSQSISVFNHLVATLKDNSSQSTSQPPVTNIVGKCGLVINSPAVNSSVAFPLIIKGIVDNSNSKNLGCAWQMFEGLAGTAQFYIYLDEENYNGWKTIGDPVIIQLENVTTNKANFTFTFNFSEGGFKINAPIKIIFTEENPAAIRPALTFELPLVLK
jgi:hypothetical protein